MRLLYGVLIALAACSGRDKAPTPDEVQPEYLRAKPKKEKKPKHFKDTVVVDTVGPDSVVVDSMTIDTAGASISSLFRLASTQVVVDSSTYKVRYSFGTWNAGDTVVVKLTRDSTAAVKPVSITRTRLTQRDSVSFKVDKVYNAVAKYTSCVRRRKNALLAEMCQFWQTDYKKVPDSMSVDSSLALRRLDIKPDRVDSVKPGQVIQFCPFIVFKDGKVAMRAQDKLKTPCPTRYTNNFSLAARSVSAKQQAIADTICVLWKATGGTITVEPCSGVPS